MKESIPEQPQPSQSVPKRRRLYGMLAVVLVVGVAALWLLRRELGNSGPEHAPSAVQIVAGAPVRRENLYREVSIPGEFRPYVEVELHAKVSGYVNQMNVDFGDKVKKDEILATLDAPDLVAQLNNAISTERKAEAAYTNAHLIFTRLVAVDKQNPNLIAQQDLDTADANDRSTFAAIDAARADRQKYQTLVGYLTITAPFDGVITRRYVDPGQLIQAGISSESQSLPVVRVSDNYLLRLDFPVSVEYVKDIHLRDAVEVRVVSLGGKSFTGTITRFTDKVDLNTRTMITEIEVPNPNLELVPGMYARVSLKVDPRAHTLAVPIEAVAVGKNPSVYVVDRDHLLQQRPVTLGIESPTKFEILSGVAEGDLVMIGHPSEVRPGQKVEPKPIESLAEDAPASGENTSAKQ